MKYKYKWVDCNNTGPTEVGSNSWNEYSFLLVGFSGGFCEHINESFGSIKYLEFVDYMNNYSFLKKGSVPISFTKLPNLWLVQFKRNEVFSIPGFQFEGCSL